MGDFYSRSENSEERKELGIVSIPSYGSCRPEVISISLERI